MSQDGGNALRRSGRSLTLTVPGGSLAVYTEPVYTVAVLDRVKGFDWDLHNVGHVARHGVAPAEVEEAVERPHAIVRAKDVGGEKR